MIRITSKRDGFRRAGMAHPKEPTEYPDDHFSLKEIKALQKEPMLIVEHLEDPEPEPEKMTIAQLSEALADKGVKIPDKAKKAELVALYKENL